MCDTQPSPILTTSRLRSAIGLRHLRFLKIDYRRINVDVIRCLLPDSVWTAPDTRLGLISHVHEYVGEVSAPIHSASISTTNQLYKALGHKTQHAVRVVHFSGPDVGTIDLTIFSDEASPTGCSRMKNLEPGYAARKLAEFIYRPRPGNPIRDVTLDLRRVKLDPPPSATIVHLRTIATKIATGEHLHKSANSVEIIFRAASNEVAKVVDDALASSRMTHPTHRCRVDRS